MFNRSALKIPDYIFWVIPLIGVFLAGFQVYTENIGVLSKASRKLSKDKKIFEEIRDILESNEAMVWIRQQDFGGSFSLDHLDPIHKFNYRCQDPDFEFLDKKLENIKLDLYSYTFEFTKFIGKETYPINIPGSRSNRLPKHLSDDEHRIKSSALNDLADNINETYRTLVKMGRRKL